MRLRLGVVQMNSGEDREGNLAQAEALIEEAAVQGAQMVALPEYFSVLGRPEAMRAQAEPIPGPTTQRLARLARRHRIWLHCGSIPELVPGEDRYYNTTVVLNPQGEVVARYRKIHLFDAEVGQSAYRESHSVRPGDRPVVFDTPWGRMGLTICYDLRFGELYRALALRGALLVFVPAAFTLYTGKDHWEPLLRARAIEFQIYVAAPAQIFSHPPGRACFGSAMVVDPWGTVIARAPERIGTVMADVDFRWLQEVRARLPVYRHRRPEAYDPEGAELAAQEGSKV